MSPTGKLTKGQKDLKRDLREIQRDLMFQYTPKQWPIFVPGTQVPRPTEADLAALKKRLDFRYKQWSDRAAGRAALEGE